MPTKADRVCDDLRALCETSRRGGVSRLPTISQLARRYVVAVPTLWRAVQRLKSEGLISARPREGLILLTKQATTPLPQSVPRCRSQLIHELFVRDILEAVFLPGSKLPSVKELSGRYGCAPPTIRRVLLAVAAEGYVLAERRSFRIPAPKGTGAGEIILIARADRNGELAAITQRTDQHLQALENTCAAAGVRLIPVTWDEDKGLRYTSSKAPFAASRHSSALRGYIVWTLNMPSEIITPLVKKIHRGSVPVALLDENGETASCILPREPAPVKIFLLSDTKAAGEAIGRMLIETGHRFALFLGPVQLPFPTIQTRLNGLRAAFAHAAPGARVAVADIGDLPWHVSHLQERRLMQARIHAFADEASAFDSGISCQLAAAASAVDADGLMSGAARLCWEKCLPALNAGCTAIVALNDDLALVIMAIAAEKRIRVPAQISIVGFDNTRQGSMAGLTSYDLNGPAIMSAMVSYVLNPRGSLAGRKRGPIVISGNLIVRGSCARSEGIRSSVQTPSKN